MPRSTPKSKIAALFLILTLPLLGGCAGAVVGAGAGVGVAANQERGVKAALIDTRIRTLINYHLLNDDPALHQALNIGIYEGRVLLTGVAKSAAKRNQAVATAWKAKGVAEVINEILVDGSGKTGSFPRDTWITAQLRSKLLFDKKIIGINYSIYAVRTTVYLLGVAQNREELDLVLNLARNIQYVARVVNHVILKNDPRRKAATK
jgi:osmotically-inducible protein OsmY